MKGEALEFIDMTQSFGCRELTESNRLSDPNTSPTRRNRYMCYDCGGDQFTSKICPTCCGAKGITEANPMVQLLSNLMNYKLGIDRPSEILTLKPQFSEIKEQQGQIICDMCGNEVEMGEFMECEPCHYNYCMKCYSSSYNSSRSKKYSQKNKSHCTHEHHELKRRRYDDYTSSYSREITEDNWFQNDDNEEGDEEAEAEQQERGDGSLQMSEIPLMSKHSSSSHCKFCNEKFAALLILTCLTCEQQKKGIFQICQKCNKEAVIKHPKGHIFKPTLYRSNSKNDNDQAYLFSSVGGPGPTLGDDSPRIKMPSGNWIDESSEPKMSQIIFDEQSSEEASNEDLQGLSLVDFNKNQKDRKHQKQKEGGEEGIEFSSNYQLQKNNLLMHECEEGRVILLQPPKQKKNLIEESSRIQVFCEEDSQSDYLLRTAGILKSGNQLAHSESDFELEEDVGDCARVVMPKQFTMSKNSRTAEKSKAKKQAQKRSPFLPLKKIQSKTIQQLETLTPKILKKSSNKSRSRSASPKNKDDKIRNQSQESMGSTSTQRENARLRKADNIVRVRIIKNGKVEYIQTDEEQHEKEQEENILQEEDCDDGNYYFHDYICNFCDNPPMNIRYHCRVCLDYDLCQECYNNRRSVHPLHDKFQEFDREGEIKHQSNKEEEKKKIFLAILDKFKVNPRDVKKGDRGSEGYQPVSRSHLGGLGRKEKDKEEGEDKQKYNIRMSQW